MSDLISRQDAIDKVKKCKMIHEHNEHDEYVGYYDACEVDMVLENLPSAQPERLTDDDFETIRIHLNAQKEKLCNQQRWEEADEYQRIIDRFIAFAQPERKKGTWIFYTNNSSGKSCYVCNKCKAELDSRYTNFCPNCGADMRG